MLKGLPFLLGLCACGADPEPAPTTQIVEVASFPATPVGALDLVLQIDDSNGTADHQVSLANGILSLLDAVSWDGGLPSLHVGVVTSDLGTSGSLDPENPGPPVGAPGQGGCAGNGKNGASNSPETIIGPYLIHDEPPSLLLPNYRGSLTSVLGQLLRVGSTGCGFEQPLAATRRFFARNPLFVRPEASLAIIMLADEDDCSIRDPAFFSSDEAELGPLTSMRCTREGVECDESLTEVGAKTNCRARRDSRYVEDIDVSRTFFEALKARPDQLTVSAIVGPPAPVAIELRQINTQIVISLAHSCVRQPTGRVIAANPAVRIAELVGEFRSRGALTSVCDDDFSPQLAHIGMTIKRSLGIACIDAAALADGRAAPGVQPSCEARDVREDGTPTALPRCPAAPGVDCFELVADPRACPETAEHLRVVIRRTQPAAAGTRVEVDCEAPLPSTSG
ncbi:MAG: hypothetical protein H0T89_13120 [Deltaproteobacteria bacterium]|nr:hypothetical protein [Deltaproteobacteria bacterium]MDQ3295761.1 hypothetical protein [Myxococcota bacterium]